MARGLEAIGVQVEELHDGLIVHGSGGDPLPGGGMAESHLDHRIAMSFVVAGMVAKSPVRIDDVEPVATSFPNFFDLFARLTDHAR